MKRMLLVMSGLVIMWGGLFVIRETAQIVTLAVIVHPLLGNAVLALLLLIYGVSLGLPVVLYLRLPPPLRWPVDGSAEAIMQYRQRLAERLSQNPVLKQVAVHAMNPATLEQACQVLEKRAQAHITQTALMVFLSTAVSQSGRLDALPDGILGPDATDLADCSPPFWHKLSTISTCMRSSRRSWARFSQAQGSEPSRAPVASRPSWPMPSSMVP